MATRTRSRRTSAGDRTLPPAISGPWGNGVVRIAGAPLVYRDGSRLYDALNMYGAVADLGSTWQSRPSITRMGTIQLGSGSVRNGQCVFDHVRPDGTTDPLLFAGGKMYVWNKSISSPSVTDITPGAVTISTTARIYCVTFGGLLIVSDGVNRPWTYNPATTTATYIDIDGSGTAWTAYGQPVVYNAKLFFIRGSLSGVVNRSRIIWSEEVDPALGYQQVAVGTTYVNFWTLSQTDSDPLTALAATNAGLYYFRGESIGFITGAVNAEFQTTATHDGISQTVGTEAPASVIVVDGQTPEVYFLDRNGRQWRISNGGLQELWRARTEDDNGPPNLTSAAATTAVLLPRQQLVLSDRLVTTVPSPFRDVWDIATGKHHGQWWFPIGSARAMGVLKNSFGERDVIIIGTSDDAGGLGAEGYVYRLREPGEAVTTFDDGFWTSVAGARSITVPIGDDLERDQVFTTVTAEVYNAPNATTVDYTLTVATPRESATSTATSRSSASGYEADRVAWGVNARGRRAKLSISCDVASVTQFRIGRVIVHRSDGGSDPNGF